MAFTIICIHPIVGCKYLKILKEGEYYFFNDWYREENGHIIRNEDNTFKKASLVMVLQSKLLSAKTEVVKVHFWS